MIQVKGFAALDATSPLVPFSFERRELRVHDVLVDILFSGVCHSDLHQVRDEWGGSIYPMVPGHEIVGKVIKVGKEVNKFKVGDIAGVGVMVDSCRKCKPCTGFMEQYCDEGMTGTYNNYERDKITLAQGGYSIELKATGSLQIPASASGYLLISKTESRFEFEISNNIQSRMMKPSHYIWIEAGNNFTIKPMGNQPANFVLLQLK